MNTHSFADISFADAATRRAFEEVVDDAVRASRVGPIDVFFSVEANARATRARRKRSGVVGFPPQPIHHGVALGREGVGGRRARAGETDEAHDAGGTVFGVGAIGGGEESAGDQGV